MLDFFHHTYTTMRPTKKLLEVGGGPTIYQLISASSKVESITFSDFNVTNLTEVRNWADGKPTAFDWSSYVKYVATLEGQES